MLGRACLSAFLALACCSIASAQDAAVDEARRHFEAGTQAFDTGDYERAVTEFERSYALTQHPDLLFNIYSAAERAGQLERAVTALEGFLAEGEVEPARRPVLEERLAHMRERLAEAQAAADPAPEPEPAPEPVSAPEPEPEPEPAPAPSGVHPAGVATLIAGGVLLAGFGVLAALSEVEDGNLAAGCGMNRACTSEDVATLNALNIAADVSWIAGATAAVVGVVLLLALPPESASSQVALAPWAAPNAAGLAAAGRF